MEKGFLSLRGRGGGRGVKEKQSVDAEVPTKSNYRVTDVTTSTSIVYKLIGTHWVLILGYLMEGLGNASRIVDQNPQRFHVPKDANFYVRYPIASVEEIKVHDVPVVAYTLDGLSIIATALVLKFVIRANIIRSPGNSSQNPGDFRSDL
ncbi:hypothetical protein Tco_1571101 [Tanacetum coccineum]